MNKKTLGGATKATGKPEASGLRKTPGGRNHSPSSEILPGRGKSAVGRKPGRARNFQRSRNRKRNRQDQTKRIRTGRRPTHGCGSDRFGFCAALAALLPAAKLQQACAPRRSLRGRPPELARTTLIPALLFHVMNAAGTLAEHLLLLTGRDYADSTLSGRRAVLPWELFQRLLRFALRPLAQRRKHPDAFWRKWRLVAIDGVRWSLTNTPQNERARPKTKTRRGRAAFAKLESSVLLELGLHNPLAAAIARNGESEWVLSRSLLAHLAKGCLLLADRLYGCAAFVALLLDRCLAVGSHFLVRVRGNIKVKVIKRYRDGSALVEVPVYKKGTRTIERWIRVREIRRSVQRKGFLTYELRLWTSLLDPQEASAAELAPLYAKRWEHELYYRNIKLALRKTDLLQSHTPETAAQEVAAIVICSALLAQERARAADGKKPVLSISFVKTLELMRPLWLVLAVGADLLSERQQQKLVERFLQMARRMVTAKRRSRSCKRAVRQPIKGWPRLIEPDSHEGPLIFRTLPIPSL